MSQTKAQLLEGKAANIEFSAGTAALPAITFTGDINTGIYSPAADTIAFTEGGVEAMRLDASGRVGIGTTSPATSLHVQGGAGATAYATFAGNNGSPESFIIGQDVSGLTRLFHSGAYPITFWTNTTERARIDSSGRLLVGTSSSPSVGDSQYSYLVVQGYPGSSTGNANISLQRGETAANITSGEQIGDINFTDSAGYPFAKISCIADANAGSNDYPGRLVFSTTADGASSPTARMKIQNSGYINTYSTSNGFIANVSAAAGTSTFLYAGNRSSSDIEGNGGITVYYVYSNGTVQNATGTYTAISDVKLKENIVDASSQWDDLKAIQIRNWNFKEETGHETHRQLGPIAQELEQVCPGLVFETPDRDAEGNDLGTTTKGVNQSVLYMKAVKALQEAMDRIEQLETEMAAVKAKLS